jgi:hypothetical protein
LSVTDDVLRDGHDVSPCCCRQPRVALI